MLTLNTLYSDLGSFFVNILGVEKMTTKMVYDKLIAAGLSVNDTKQTLIIFSSLLLERTNNVFDPDPVIQKDVFPVRFPDGVVRLKNGSYPFALLDRQSLGDDFKDLAKFLDFGIDEIRTLQPLIKWAGLEDRYISKTVKEISSVDANSTRPISTPYREVKTKARSLLRLVPLKSCWPRKRLTLSQRRSGIWKSEDENQS